MAINKFNFAGIVDLVAAIIIAVSDVPYISHLKWAIVAILLIKGVPNILRP